MAFPFDMELVSGLHFNEDKQAFCFSLNQIPFRTYLGKDFTDKWNLLHRVIKGETKLCTSHIKLKDGKIFWLAVLEIEKEKHCLRPEVIAEASLSLEYPIVVKSGKAKITIGTREEFLYRRLAIQAARKRAQVGATYSRSSNGIKRKTKAVDKISRSKTTSIVDLDQLFDTFNPQTRAALQKVIQGSSIIYAGHTHGANQTYKYFAPALDSTQRLLAELTRDQTQFTNFLVSSSKVLTAVAARRNQLSALVPNSNQALGAIASQNQALDRSLVALPPSCARRTRPSSTCARSRRSRSACRCGSAGDQEPADLPAPPATRRRAVGPGARRSGDGTPPAG